MKKIKKLTNIPQRIIGKTDRYRANIQYKNWLKSLSHQPRSERLTKEPLISIIVPVYNTPRKIFYEMIESVLGQLYKNWELILVDDASPDASIRQFIVENSNKDGRIKRVFLQSNKGISGATNEGIKISKGEYVALLDHDDVLRPEALYEVASSISLGDYEFIYTDEDKISTSVNRRFQPFFKPGYNRDLLWSVNYITHFTVIKKSLLDKAGYENSKYDGAQDWELFFRCLRHTEPKKVHHIPKILYSWRVHKTSTAKDLSIKPYALEAQKAAIDDELKARGFSDFSITPHDEHLGQWRMKLSVNGAPKVDICILSGQEDQSQIQEIKKNTSYKKYEIHYIDPIDTKAVMQLPGEYLIFVSDKLAIKNHDWVEELIGDAQRDDLAFIQAELKSKADFTDNLRSILDEESLKATLNMDTTNTSRVVYKESRYNIDSVHGGVAAIQISKLKQVLDSNQPIDISRLSSELVQKGYRNLYNPYVKVLK